MNHADGERAALREIHEALVLTHLMAVVKPELWVEWFVVEERCYLTPWFIPTKHRIQFKYVFMFHEDEHMDGAFLAWEDSMEALLGGSEPSAAFERDLSRVQDLLKQHNIQWGDLEPIPILLRAELRLSNFAEVVLKNLVTLVEETRQVEQDAAHGSVAGLLHRGRGVIFRVTALEIDLSDHFLTVPLFTTLQDVLQLGVDVECLSLPKLALLARVEDGFNTGEVGRFMRTLLGLSENPNGQVTRVRRLKMSDHYLRSIFLAPFCSTLACAQHLQVLHITSSDAGIETSNTSEERRRHMWLWLSFALFSSASTSRLEALVIDGMEIGFSDVEVTRAVIASQDPFAAMWELVQRNAKRVGQIGATGGEALGVSHSPHMTRHTVVMQLEGSWTVRDGLVQKRFTIIEPFVVVGELIQSVQNQAADGIYETLYIPGLGFCEPYGDSPPNLSTKERVDPEPAPSRSLSPLHTLVVRGQLSRRDGTAVLEELLALIGPRLQSLSIKIPGIGEVSLGRVLSACPRLENLALTSARLTSMNVFLEAYIRDSRPLFSLALPAISVPESQLQFFLRMLLQNNKVESTLCRLELGASWANELSNATIAILRNILDHNKTLTHLVVHVAAPQSRWVRALLDPYHGQLVEGLSYTERARRMATLGGLGRAALANPKLALNDDTKRLVLTLAAPAPIHRVVCWFSTPISDALTNFLD